MFDNRIELASDLEWMLQSGQAKTTSLVRALVRDQYQRLLEQAQQELSYPTAARQAADEIIQIAIKKTDHYRGDQGVQAWLDEIAGTVIGRRKAEIQGLSLLNPRLNQSLLDRYPPPQITPQQVEETAERLTDQILAGNRRLGKRAGAQEILVACLAVVMVFGLLRAAGIIPSSTDEPPRTSPTASTSERVSRPEAAAAAENLPFHPLRGIPPQAPLSINSSHDDVWKRMLLSRFLWHSLWADLVVVLYGPEGYIGPPKAERHQVWIEQDQNALLVSGEPYNGPAQVELITPNGSFPQLNPVLQGVADISRLGSQIPWFYLSEDTIFSSPYLINYFFLGNHDWPPQIKEFAIVKADRWAGREAVIVEQTDPRGELEARLWLDSATGLILREQYFAPDDPQKLLLETVVTAVAINQDFPDDLFTSPYQYMEWNLYGEARNSLTFSPEGELYPWLANQDAIEMTPEQPPADFDPSNSQLRFLYSGEIIFGPARATEVQVLADNYSLGKIKINHLYKTTCIRSPDGRLIGLFTQDNPPSLLNDLFTLYKLPGLEQLSLTFPGNVLVRAVFSPDSRKLAVAGINLATTQGSLFLVDLDSGERQELSELSPVYSLAWSPEGSKLAALHWPNFQQIDETIVQISEYDLVTNKLVRHNLTADLDWGSPEMTIPLDGWQASFQLTMGGLESCTAAPAAGELTPSSPPSPSDRK